MTATFFTPTPRTLPLASEKAVLPLVGGKGANLAKLALANFPVPDGFLITTLAYESFVAANGLAERIQSVLPVELSEETDSLGQVSAKIRSWFSAGELSPDLSDELRTAYTGLGRPAVAVRSSATAEDLPEMSFAGQQDSYLNVIGADAMLKAVIDCWSSLWTARAISYRIRNGVPHDGAAVAVVVQKMVQSQVSGVLFTANPLSGLRAETVIDATLGLGEALVSGQVEPDHYVVDTNSGKITTRKIGAKAISIRSKAGGGTLSVEETSKENQALPDAQIQALTQFGCQVAALFGVPQDIEWAWAENSLYLLQSRPITSLFPVPEGCSAEPLKVFLSFGAVQGLLAPITPFGQDMLRLFFSAGARFFGYRVTPETQTVLLIAGERLWINITPLASNSVGRRILPFVMNMIEPTISQALKIIWNDPRIQPGKPGLSLRSALRLAGFFPPLAGNLLLNLISPDVRRNYILNNGEHVLDLMHTRSAAIRGDRRSKLIQRLTLLPDLAVKQLPCTLILFISGIASGMALLNMLNNLAKSIPDEPGVGTRRPWNDLVLEATRGLPHNPTTEMDLILWDTAQTIRCDPQSLKIFKEHTAPELTSLDQSGKLPQAAQQAVDRFLEKYGERGLAEIDSGRERWREDPTHVFEAIGSYLQIEDNDHAPDAVFRRSAASAQTAVEQLAASISKTSNGRFKARQLRFVAGRMRALLGLRESPKFFAVRLIGVVRQAILESGLEFYQAGELDRPDDLCYLYLSEIKAFASGEQRDWRCLITKRRENYRRELMRRQIPRLLLSDGRAFYEGIVDTTANQGDTTNVIVGSPVSPGSVEGSVRIVLDPRQAHLLPGEILVCPGTDPSWTPLFLTAAGLVMEVGGMMTHGAVVAREYGIPAIVGVDRATQRLQTGQHIRINGSSGQIQLLDGAEKNL